MARDTFVAGRKTGRGAAGPAGARGGAPHVRNLFIVIILNIIIYSVPSPALPPGPPPPGAPANFVPLPGERLGKRQPELVDRPGDAERRDPGMPRAADDPPAPPAGAPPGIHTLKQLSYSMPYYSATPGEASVDFFRKLAEADPKAAEPRGRLAHALLQLSRHDEATAAANAALALDPADQWALYTLALCHVARADRRAAAGFYERLLATDFAKFRDHFVTRAYIGANYADLLLRDGRTAEAEVAAEASLAVPRPDPLSLKLLDRFYLRTGRIDRALAVYGKILERDPENLNAHMNLGALHLYAGNVDLSLSHLERAWAADPKIMKTAYFLHRAWYRKGDAARAAQWLDRCASFDPKEQAALDFRADRVTPYPCYDILRQCAALASGDRKAFLESQEELFEQDEEDAAQGAIAEEQILDRLLDAEGYPEFKEEEALRYRLERMPVSTAENRFVAKLRAAMDPASPAGRERAGEISRLLVEERDREALSAALAEHARAPEVPRFLAQAGIAAQGVKDGRTSMELLERALRVRMPGGNPEGGDAWFDLLGEGTAASLTERDEAGYLARVFTLLCVTDRLVLRRVGAGETARHLRTEATEHLSEAEAKRLGEVYARVRADLAAVAGRSDSLTARAFASLLASNFASLESDSLPASRAWRDALKRDPDLTLVYELYRDYGKYFGF